MTLYYKKSYIDINVDIFLFFSMFVWMANKKSGYISIFQYVCVDGEQGEWIYFYFSVYLCGWRTRRVDIFLFFSMFVRMANKESGYISIFQYVCVDGEQGYPNNTF